MKEYSHFVHLHLYAFIALINFAICHNAHGETSLCDDYDYILRGDSSNLIFEEFAGTPNRSRMTGSFTSVQEGLPGFKLRPTTSSKMMDYYFATAAEYAMAGEEKYIYALQTGVFSAGRKKVPSVPGFDYKSGYYRIYRPNQTIPDAVYTGQMFAPHQIAIVDPSEQAWGITPLPRSFQNGAPVFEEGAASVFGPAHPLGRTAPKRDFPLSKPRPRPSSTGSRPGIRSPMGAAGASIPCSAIAELAIADNNKGRDAVGRALAELRDTYPSQEQGEFNPRINQLEDFVNQWGGENWPIASPENLNELISLWEDRDGFDAVSGLQGFFDWAHSKPLSEVFPPGLYQPIYGALPRNGQPIYIIQSP